VLLDNATVKYGVVVNPNNPMTTVAAPEDLLSFGNQLNRRGGFLLVDEAFIDATPAISVSANVGGSGLVVLRSLGKFFGLAGVRLGFVLADEEIRRQLSRELPAWSISTPARWIGEQALRDENWQTQQRLRIEESMPRWLNFLRAKFPTMNFQCSTLFVTGFSNAQTCESIFDSLAEIQVLVRLFDQSEGVTAVRFGLASQEQLKSFNSRYQGQRGFYHE